jgi:hypothetical protein
MVKKQVCDFMTYDDGQVVETIADIQESLGDHN